MNLNPFGTVNDYPTMLNKISTFVFLLALLLIAYIRSRIPSIEQILAPYNFQIPIVSGFAVPLGTIVPAFAIAVITRIFKLHDRLSDFFKIRQEFDVHNILYPMALATMPGLFLAQVKRLSEQRIELMSKVFYKYASSTPGKAVIDSHYITLALDQWSWYWIISEGSFLAIVSSLILIWGGDGKSAAILLIIVIVTDVIILPRIIKLCARYALDEVEQILSDNNRKTEIAGVFRAL